MLRGKRARIKNQSKRHLKASARKVHASAKAKKIAPDVSPSKFENIVTNLLDAIVEVDSTGRFSYASPQIFELAGFRPEELVGKPYTEFIPPDDFATLAQAFVEALAEGGAVKRQHRARHKDGHYLWIQASGKLINSAQNPRFLIVLSDITKYKQAEVALHEREALYRGLFENAPISVSEDDYSAVKAYLDSLGPETTRNPEKYLQDHPEVMQRCMQLVKTNHLNRAALAIFGVKDADELMRNLLKLYSQESVDQFRKGIVAILKGQTKLTMETRLKNMSGEFRNVKISWQVAPGFEKDYSKVLVSTVNITELKHSEAALRESEGKYRTLFYSAPMSIAILDLELKVLEVNGHFGVPVRDIIGKDWLEFWKVPAEDRAFIKQVREKLLKGEKVASVLRKYKILGKDFWVEIHPALLEKDGKPFGFQVIARDITESKKLEEQLLQAQKMEAIGRLSGGVAHDFNNQLTVIMNETEMIQHSLPEDDPLQKQLDTIMQASERSAALTAQLLVFSRKQIIEPKIVNINEIIGLSAKMLERLIGEDIKLNLELPPGRRPGAD